MDKRKSRKLQKDCHLTIPDAVRAMITLALCFLLLPVWIPSAVFADETEDSPVQIDQTLPEGIYDSLEALADKTIGIETGSSFDELVSKRLPNAKKEYYNSKVDLVNALIGYKIDAFEETGDGSMSPFSEYSG